MHVTAPEPARGRGHARLQAHIDAFDRLYRERPPALERLEQELGPELAHKLVFALSGAGRRQLRVVASAA